MPDADLARAGERVAEEIDLLVTDIRRLLTVLEKQGSCCAHHEIIYQRLRADIIMLVEEYTVMISLLRQGQ